MRENHNLQPRYINIGKQTHNPHHNSQAMMVLICYLSRQHRYQQIKLQCTITQYLDKCTAHVTLCDPTFGMLLLLLLFLRHGTLCACSVISLSDGRVFQA